MWTPVLLCVVCVSVGGCTAITGANKLEKTDDCLANCGDTGTDVTDTYDAPPLCSDAKITAWLAPTKLDKVGGPGTKPGVLDPYVVPDGLSLYFVATDTTSGMGRIFFTTRATRTDSFAGGTALAGLEALASKSLAQPAVGNPREVIFASEGDLWVGTRGAPTGPVTADRYAPGDLNTADAEDSPTVSASADLRMVFVRTKSGARSRLFEAKRSDPSPGGAWSDIADSVLSGDAYDLTCPALSPDGLTLFYASNVGETGSSSVYVARRPKLDATFNPPDPVPALTVKGKINCPRSITADGCELYLSNDSSGSMTSYVARRSL
jgi:hypothetical protein